MSKRIYRWLDRIHPVAAWALVAAALATFVGVAANIITTGDAKWATLLVSADLFVSGYGELRAEAKDRTD